MQIPFLDLRYKYGIKQPYSRNFNILGSKVWLLLQLTINCSRYIKIVTFILYWFTIYNDIYISKYFLTFFIIIDIG